MIDTFLQSKRAGGSHSAESIGAFIGGVVDGSVSRAQAAAWLAFTFVRGLDDAEAVALTRAMTDSGDRLSWPAMEGPFVDKHSTGGVGDKVSLVLAPLWAELGWKVPMISGRGLGHTGGTLDKLEAIPGFRVDLDEGALRRVLREVGCFISGQTGQLAPADRILYALRNETQTVECIPLIVASILSKKLAEGLDRLVLDVKVGSGAFMTSLGDATDLARALVRVGNGSGVRTHALLTDMSQPLGRACGNALEVREAVDCLQGGGPPDLRALTLALTDDPRAEGVLASGAAYERFARMVRAQGGDLDRPLPVASHTMELCADRAGVVARCDARGIGRAAFLLGAGRLRAEDSVHPGVGVTLVKKVGDRVDAGEVMALLHGADRPFDPARAEAQAAFSIGEAALVPPLLLGTLPAPPC